MDTPRYRIGNDLVVLWAINNRDGSPYSLDGKEVRLYVSHARGREEVDVVLSTLDDGTVNNVIRWDFAGDDQRVLGTYTLTAEILASEDHKEIRRDICEAFTLVSRSCQESDEEGEANIMDGGDLILSTRLDIYRFGIPKISIGSNGNWFIDGVDTGVSAMGGGEGLVNKVYNEEHFGQSFDRESDTDTFNAHAIDSLKQKIESLSEAFQKIGIEDIGGMMISVPETDHILVYDGSQWINLSFQTLMEKYGISEGGGEGTQFWKYDEENNAIYTDYDVYSKGQIAAGGIAGSEDDNGGSGGGSIETLSDVLLSSLANGDVLVYDSAALMWKNVPQSSLVPSLDGYATQEWVKAQKYLAASEMDGYATTEYVDEADKKITERVSALEGMWQLDADGNVWTDRPVYSTKQIAAGGVGEEGEAASGTVNAIQVGDTLYQPVDGVVTLPETASGIDSIGDAEDVELTDVKEGDTIVYNSATAKFVNRPSTYVHTQSTVASVWTVTHNMGKYPSVMVVDSARNVVCGDVKYDGPNQLTITFSATFSGYAYLN